MLFGRNALSPLLLEIIGNPNVGRFRDAFVVASDGGVPEIHVYTRNGGGNREHYADGEASAACDCTGCIITHQLPAHPLYLGDRDDDFDYTYATVRFRVPEKFLPLVGLLANKDQATAEKWKDLFARLNEAGPTDPQVARVAEALRPVFEKLTGGAG